MCALSSVSKNVYVFVKPCGWKRLITLLPPQPRVHPPRAGGVLTTAFSPGLTGPRGRRDTYDPSRACAATGSGSLRSARREGSEKRQGWALARDGCTDHCRRCARTASPPFPPAARGSTHTRASSAPPHLSTSRCVSGREAACGSRGANGTRAVPASRQPTLGQSARQSCAVECC